MTVSQANEIRAPAIFEETIEREGADLPRLADLARRGPVHLGVLVVIVPLLLVLFQFLPLGGLR